MIAKPFTLTTPRLTLRKLGREDLEALVALDSDPEVMRYINGGIPSTRAQVEGMLARMLAWAPDDPVGFYAALAQTPARPDLAPAGLEWIGWFHLRPSIDPLPGALELGYRLRRSAWGRGYASEGSRALADFAWAELDPPALDGCAMPDNHASIAVLRKCGLGYVDRRPHPRAPEIEVAFYRAAADATITPR